MKLYELTGNYLILQQMLEEAEDQQAILDTIESIEAVIEEKADNYARIIKNLEADIAGIKTEEQRLADKRRTLENNVKWLKGNLEESMRATGKTKFKTTLFSFGIQKNPPSVEILDENKIPAEYLIPQNPVVDKKAILAALREGKEFDFAQLKQGESLRIR